MATSDDFTTVSSALSELNPTTIKALVPGLISTFAKYEEQNSKNFLSLKTSLMQEITLIERRVRVLEEENSSLKKKLASLEDRMENASQEEVRSTLVLSGSLVPPAQTNEKCLDIVQNLLRTHLSIEVQAGKISTATRLTSKRSDETARKNNLIVKFCQPSMKADIILAARKKKVNGFYVNEFLTPVQKTIGFVLRKAKREFPGVISGTTSLNGKNYVWLKKPRPETRGAKDIRQQITTHDRLKDFC